MTTYRVGRKLGRTIYRGDTLIGMMDTVEDAERVVAAMNGLSNADREALRDARACVVNGHPGMTKSEQDRAIALLDRLLGGEG